MYKLGLPEGVRGAERKFEETMVKHPKFDEKCSSTHPRITTSAN